MTHKCQYCDKIIEPCPKPCHDKFNHPKTHVCCTCPSESCELSHTVDSCDREICNLKFTVDWYKRQFAKAQAENANNLEKLNQQTSIINSYKIINVEPKHFIRMLEESKLDTSEIKLFWSRKATKWGESFPSNDDEMSLAYELMILCEAGFKLYADLISKSYKGKAIVQIKREQSEKTNKKLAQAQQIRAGITNSDGTKKSEKQIKQSVRLTDIEKLVLNQIKLYKCTQEQSEQILLGMGTKLEPKPRNLKELGLL